MRRLIISLVLLGAVGIRLGTLSAEPDNAWMEKVDPWVLQTAAPQPTTLNASMAYPQTEFLVYLTEQADLSLAATYTTKLAKGTYVYTQLTAVARQTQPAVTAQLDALGVPYQTFWIANMIWVRGDLTDVEALARRDDVAHLYANPQVALDLLPAPDTPDDISVAGTVSGIEWNISLVGAPEVWAAGYTGQGVVIGGQDTGYDWDHPALKNQYRGWDGVTVDHNYNWHYGIPTGDSTCAAIPNQPCDDYSSSHGTHTMGTMIGNDLDPGDASWPAGAANAVGMAPGATWIGCRNMNQGNGTPASYTSCYEWFVAPTDLNGMNPDPGKAPHVINNSWGCPPSEGCTDPAVLETVVNNVRAAGIVTVHAAGNEGSACNTVQNPATTYDASFSVGATASNDTIAGFSSRGPSTFDGGLKPDISAPGVSVRSTIRDGNYSLSNGTSMAAPHVAGLVALLISANPDLAGDVDAIENLIQQTAVPLTTTQGCGGDTSTSVPNHVYGYGRINALNALSTLFPYHRFFPIFFNE